MKYKPLAFVIILIIFSNGYAYSQIGNKIITGVSKKEIDTLAFENTKKLVEEAKGLLEKEVNPKTYVIGPNDQFSISILSAEPLEFDAVVSPEGLLMLKGAGTVNLKNKTLDQSYSLIENQIHKYYNSENIFVVLKDIRNFKVIVTGAVRKSVTVAATAMDRVSEVIDKAGGTIPESSIRKISVRRGDSTLKCDLLKFFLIGDSTANPFVKGGDVIIVSNMDEFATIGAFGEFISEGEFEYVEGDSLSTLIRFVQGFTNSANLSKIEFARFGKKGHELERRILDLSGWKGINNINKPLKGDFQLREGDRVFARKKIDWDKQEYVIIEGEVKYPGKYPIIEGNDKLSDLLNWTNGFTDDASVQNTEFIRQQDLERKDPEMERLSKLPPSEMSKSEFKYYQARIREKKGVLSVNFIKLVEENDASNDIYLQNKDSVIVPKKSFFINIQGRVNNPGKIKYVDGLTYMDYIQLAGGFGYRAAPDETLVTNNQGEIFLAKSMDYEISPGDVILVPPEDETTFVEVFTEALTITTQLATVMGVVLTIINLSNR